jgi:hypothetical protein
MLPMCSPTLDVGCRAALQTPRAVHGPTPGRHDRRAQVPRVAVRAGHHAGGGEGRCLPGREPSARPRSASCRPRPPTHPPNQPPNHPTNYITKPPNHQACEAIDEAPSATGHLDGDTAISRGSFRAALAAAGAVCAAVDEVVGGKVRRGGEGGGRAGKGQGHALWWSAARCEADRHGRCGWPAGGTTQEASGAGQYAVAAFMGTRRRSAYSTAVPDPAAPPRPPPAAGAQRLLRRAAAGAPRRAHGRGAGAARPARRRQPRLLPAVQRGHRGGLRRGAVPARGCGAARGLPCKVLLGVTNALLLVVPRAWQRVMRKVGVEGPGRSRACECSARKALWPAPWSAAGIRRVALVDFDVSAAARPVLVAAHRAARRVVDAWRQRLLLSTAQLGTRARGEHAPTARSDASSPAPAPVRSCPGAC